MVTFLLESEWRKQVVNTISRLEGKCHLRVNAEQQDTRQGCLLLFRLHLPAEQEPTQYNNGEMARASLIYIRTETKARRMDIFRETRRYFEYCSANDLQKKAALEIAAKSTAPRRRRRATKYTSRVNKCYYWSRWHAFTPDSPFLIVQNTGERRIQRENLCSLQVTFPPHVIRQFDWFPRQWLSY